MLKGKIEIDGVRVSRAGHTFHERWAARRALQLVFPKDELFSIVVEGLSKNEKLSLGKDAEDIADLVLYFGPGESFETCSHQQILQFKYKYRSDPVTSSYLKKTIKKFAATLRELRTQQPSDQIAQKLSFGFVTNAEFSEDLTSAVAALKDGRLPRDGLAKRQAQFLSRWCDEERINAADLIPLIDFQTSTSDLPTQDRSLRRTISDWSSNVSGQAAIRLHALVELVRQKAQIEGQNDNSIRREDVLDALECDDDQLFPADTRFVDVGDVVDRESRESLAETIASSNLPVFLHADGGVGKTVFVQSLAAYLSDQFEVVVFDCFGGGSYRSEAQARHSPKVGLLQIANELAARGLCDPLLPTDADYLGIVEIARKRLRQASNTVEEQSRLEGVLIVLDAADNAQLEAGARNETAFPRLLLASLSDEPIDGVRLLLTARTHRMDGVIGNSKVQRIALPTFTENETRQFLESRREGVSAVDFAMVMSRSRGNARVLEYLVDSWGTDVAGEAPSTQIKVEHLIAQKCEAIVESLHTAGWSDTEVVEFFAALALLPPPIPLNELAGGLGWEASQVNSAAADLAPMLELVKHGVVFRDEPTETYIREKYAEEKAAQQSIADRLRDRQTASTYAAEALPHFLVVIGDSNRAYDLANSQEFPKSIDTESGKRRLKLTRLMAAFSLATREGNLDRALTLSMKLSQVAAANERGDEFIRRSPSLAMMLGDKDVARRLFIDRSGWRGARDARLVIAYCLSGDLDEAQIHQQRAVGWINWFLRHDDESKQLNRSGPEARDLAAILFLNVLKSEFSRFNQNVEFWRFRFALSVIEELLSLCELHEHASGSRALQNLAEFAASKNCSTLALQIGLLSASHRLSRKNRRAIARAASRISALNKDGVPNDQVDHHKGIQGAVSNAAMAALIENSKQSATRILKLTRYPVPSRYDYGERHGTNSIWIPVQSACVAAWSAGNPLTYSQLLPGELRKGRKARSISSSNELRDFLKSLLSKHEKGRKPQGNQHRPKRLYSDREADDIAQGIDCILNLVEPLQAAFLSRKQLTTDTLAEFLEVWNASLRPNIHWNSETGRDEVSRRVGLGLARVLLRHADAIGRAEAERLIEIVSENRFGTGEKQGLLALLARRRNLADVAGAYAFQLCEEIVRDDYIEQRGDGLRELAGSLVPLSLQEGKEYYRQGLAQLDQMGSGDFDIVFSALHYAAEQPGGYVSAASAHRLMGLCHSIFQYEARKFGWTLFGRAVANSIGSAAIYKLLRWDDQEVADYSYGLPQLACFLAKKGQLDPRRAAVLLTICEDHGWHDWQVGEGVGDLLEVAAIEDRPAIFSVITKKLKVEYSNGGWGGLWKSLVECIDRFPDQELSSYRSQFQGRYDEAEMRRKREDDCRNPGLRDVSLTIDQINDGTDDSALEARNDRILRSLSFSSVSSIDETLLSVQAGDGFGFDHKKAFHEALIARCPYDERADFLEAICQSEALEFDETLDLLSDCLSRWKGTTAHLQSKARGFVKTLFEHKGSELFHLRYSGITRRINQIAELSSDPKFSLQIVLETIAKERLELTGNEWLQIATCLSSQATPQTALSALEDLLASPTAKVGEEIGEGEFCEQFVGEDDQAEVFADALWHLLGDQDAYVRWHAARSINALVELGLTCDLERLLARFDKHQTLSLKSEGQEFAFRNAQQWLLMGLARAALHQGPKLGAVRPVIEAVAARSDLHVVHKLHLARTLDHITGAGKPSKAQESLWREVRIPPHGTTTRDGFPDHTESKIDFDFDYEFGKHEISGLARLFGINDNEAHDAVAEEVIRRWPGKSKMSDFPGRTSYRRESNERFESFREHVQRHALIDAACTLLQSRPVVRAQYYDDGYDPWKEWLKEQDVSFEDGSWLSDHRDQIPKEARESFLGERNGRKENLVGRDVLFERLSLTAVNASGLFPLYGHWTSPDGVNVRITSALTKARGAISHCQMLSRVPDHDFWLPLMGSGGTVDRLQKKSAFTPMIWDPEVYPIGVDDGDQWATRLALGRARLGKALTKSLGLKPDQYDKCWRDSQNELVLLNQVWGEWKPTQRDYREREQDNGTILWADRSWLDSTLYSGKCSLVQTITLSKYKSRSAYDDSPGLRAVYVGLKPAETAYRIWHAKKASKTVY